MDRPLLGPASVASFSHGIPTHPATIRKGINRRNALPEAMERSVQQVNANGFLCSQLRTRAEIELGHAGVSQNVSKAKTVGNSTVGTTSTPAASMPKRSGGGGDEKNRLGKCEQRVRKAARQWERNTAYIQDTNYLEGTTSDDTPPQPHILPLPLEPPAPPSRKRKRSNGCGELLHYGAIVGKNGIWRAPDANGGRTGRIIPLEERYFSVEMADRVGLGCDPCGCQRTGVGCAVCGNPLGAIEFLCPLHFTSKSNIYYFALLPSAVSPPIPPYDPPAPRPILRPAPIPVAPPASWSRRRHPTSPPPLRIYAAFTPTPSPEPEEVPRAQSPISISPPEEVEIDWDARLAAGEPAEEEDENVPAGPPPLSMEALSHLVRHRSRGDRT
ncbi:hypothetical protein C8R43DRAFT_948162 [Mycena crocata]|nr:hypothetical protein C8R43DRAFT_948162 [Mycena crocata]